MKYQAILFDVDGTLVHSSPGILDTMRFTFAKMDKDVSNIDFMQYVGPPLRKTFAEHFDSAEQVEKAVSIYRERYHSHGQFECSLYNGIGILLETLKKEGFLLYTATSKPREVALPILEYLGIASFFDYVGGASIDASLDTKTAVIKSVLERPELQGKAVLMIGDRKDDLIGAQNCGIDSAAVLYGYGSENEIAPYKPVFVAQNCGDLLDKILKAYREKGVLIGK